MTNELHDNARDYYGKQLKSSEDLKTSACCSIESVPAEHKKLLANIDDEILDRFYGCGSPIPAARLASRLIWTMVTSIGAIFAVQGAN